MCLYPRELKNRRYQVTKKNGGKPPLMPDKRMEMIKVPCGKCSICVKKKKREWIMRITEETRSSGVPKVVTLTFSDERLEKLRLMVIKEANGVIADENILLNDMMAKAVRLWSKAWHMENGKSAKRWFITERGEKKGRIHIHGFVWGVGEEVFKQSWEKINGHVHFGKWFGAKTIVYAAKYFNKVDVVNKDYKGRMLVSPGIGKGYVERSMGKHMFRGEDTRVNYKFGNGAEAALPRYYRDKLWGDDERVELWRIALNDEKMQDKVFVNGNVYDLNKDNMGKVYERERRKDIRLGYNVVRSREEQRYRNEKKKVSKYKKK